MSTFAPPVVKDNCVYHDGFYIDVGNANRHKRASVTDLTTLLRPTTPQNSKKLSSGSVDQSRDEVGHFYEAQLVHYGLTPSKNKSVAKSRLLEALNAGKLRVSEEMQTAEKELKAQWEKENKKARAKFKSEHGIDQAGSGPGETPIVKKRRRTDHIEPVVRKVKTQSSTAISKSAAGDNARVPKEGSQPQKASGKTLATKAKKEVPAQADGPMKAKSKKVTIDPSAKNPSETKVELAPKKKSNIKTESKKKKPAAKAATSVQNPVLTLPATQGGTPVKKRRLKKDSGSMEDTQVRKEAKQGAAERGDPPVMRDEVDRGRPLKRDSSVKKQAVKHEPGDKENGQAKKEVVQRGPTAKSDIPMKKQLVKEKHNIKGATAVKNKTDQPALVGNGETPRKKRPIAEEHDSPKDTPARKEPRQKVSAIKGETPRKRQSAKEESSLKKDNVGKSEARLQGHAAKGDTPKKKKASQPEPGVKGDAKVKNVSSQKHSDITEDTPIKKKPIVETETGSAKPPLAQKGTVSEKQPFIKTEPGARKAKPEHPKPNVKSESTRKKLLAVKQEEQEAKPSNATNPRKTTESKMIDADPDPVAKKEPRFKKQAPIKKRSLASIREEPDADQEPAVKRATKSKERPIAKKESEPTSGASDKADPPVPNKLIPRRSASSSGGVKGKAKKGGQQQAVIGPPATSKKIDLATEKLRAVPSATEASLDGNETDFSVPSLPSKRRPSHGALSRTESGVSSRGFDDSEISAIPWPLQVNKRQESQKEEDDVDTDMETEKDEHYQQKVPGKVDEMDRMNDIHQTPEHEPPEIIYETSDATTPRDMRSITTTTTTTTTTITSKAPDADPGAKEPTNAEAGGAKACDVTSNTDDFSEYDIVEMEEDGEEYGQDDGGGEIYEMGDESSVYVSSPFRDDDATNNTVYYDAYD